ncbi:MAG: hypothetical protein EA393_11775 [Bacteroidetes bacterium]|nr:MAG: hypothetical protein EA393_11775 [Bacteroidota bacterium]
MDELNELKKIWNRSFEKEPEAADRKRLLEIISRKSSGPIGKLKKSIRIEIGALIITIPLLIAILFELPEPYFIFNTSMLILAFSGSLIYYFKSLRKLEKTWKESQQNLRQALESTIMLTKFFRKSYFWLNVILFPFGIYFGYIVGFGLGSGGKRVTSLPVFEHMPLFIAILVILVFVMVLFGLFWLFLKYYVRKLYDVHIEKLEEIYKELMEYE